MHYCAAMTNQEQQQPQTKLLALFVAGINARNSRWRVPSERTEIKRLSVPAAFASHEESAGQSAQKAGNSDLPPILSFLCRRGGSRQI
jgi:hypothetical protein